MASSKAFFQSWRTQTIPHKLSLRANFSWSFAGNVVYALCQWGMMVVLTKLGSPEMVGQFALSLAVTAPVIMFTNMQLRSIQATDASKKFKFSHYLKLRLITNLFALLFILGLAILSGYRRETMLVILVVGLAKSVEAISDVFYGLLQQHERMDWVAQSMLIKGPLSLIALALGVYFTHSIFWGVAGMGITWVLVLIFYDLTSGIKIIQMFPAVNKPTQAANEPTNPINLQENGAVLVKLTQLALPLGIATMLVSINLNIPRYFVAYYWGEHELGIFSAIVYLMVIGGTIINALGQSASPRLAQYYATDQFQAFKQLLLKLIAVGICIGSMGVVAAVTVGDKFLALIYQPEYARQDVFVLLMLAAGIGYLNSFFGYSLVAVRHFRVQFPLYTVVVAVTALMSWQLIPLAGLQGAALALTGGAIVQAVGAYLIVNNRLKNSCSRGNHDTN